MMRLFARALPIIFSVLLILNCAAQRLPVKTSNESDAAKSEYYRFVRINGREEIKGRFLIEPGLENQTPGYRFDYDAEGTLSRVQFIPGPIPNERTYELEAARLEFHYGKEADDKTFEERLYFTQDGKPYQTIDNIHSIKIVRDRKGRPDSLAFFDSNGNPIEDRRGIARIRFTLAQSGRKMQENYENLEGTPQPAYWRENPDGKYWETHFRYDGKGNVLDISHYGKNGAPLLERTSYGYDELGNRIAERFYDGNGKPRKQYGAYRILYKYDNWGNITEKRYLESNGHLIEAPETGVAIYQTSYDQYGNQVVSKFYDKAGQLKQHAEGYAFVRSIYDMSKHAAEYRFYDLNGNLVTLPMYGAPIKRTQWDENGHLLEISLHDQNGELKGGNPLGGGKYSSRMDEKTGKQIAVLTPSQNNIARMRWYYDAQGQMIKRESYDPSGKMVDQLSPR